MLVEREALCRALGATDIEAEPVSLSPGAPERLTATLAGGRRTFFVRRSAEDDRRETHLAVMEALERSGFRHTTTLVALVDGTAIETFVEGLTAMQVEPAATALDAAIDAFAALHALRLREGLRWGQAPVAMLPGADMQLFRLGFTSAERDAAAPWLAAAAEALAASTFGFCHGAATADHVVFGRTGPQLVNFERAGFGPQLFDVAAFLATAGVPAEKRRELAARYAEQRGLGEEETADLTDMATLLWGLDWLLGLPRRLIVNLGDDVASAELRLMASRVNEAVRSPAGDHPAAAGLRRALWGD